MAVSRKGKRKIVIDDSTFYWYVKWDDSWYFENIVHILDENMQPFFCYIVGRTIKLSSTESSIWIESNRLHNPENVDEITPRIVSLMIKWYLENKENE